MSELLAALDAFVQEHRRCGELEGGADGERVWLACDCESGGSTSQRINPIPSALKCGARFSRIGAGRDRSYGGLL